MARSSNAIWDIQLATEDAAKDLEGSILFTKTVRLHTKYLRTRKTQVTLHGVPLYISEDQLGYFFAQFCEVSDVSPVKSKTGIATGDMENWITVTRKNFISKYVDV